MKIETLDLNFLGREHVIASYLLLGDGDAALIEAGPANCVPTLLAGLEASGVAPEDVSEVFLTHIHLDHAGASGHLAERLPNATFYVHERGYRHLVDPSKLWRSATRIYGQRMDELWGAPKPVPEDRLRVLADGEETGAAGGILTTHDTPGHAYHHLAYLEPDSGTLFAGDVAGIRLPGHSYVRPPTPPPEIDVELWVGSIGDIRRLEPRNLRLTHFGGFDDVERHLTELEQRLQDWLLFVERRVEEGSDREEISFELANKGDEEMLAAGTGEPHDYDLAGNYEMLTDGLMRYVERRTSAG
jgi:glyoxylase-like metal-dependent hydrolase (beta-lactamase superfamily II)